MVWRYCIRAEKTNINFLCASLPTFSCKVKVYRPVQKVQSYTEKLTNYCRPRSNFNLCLEYPLNLSPP